MRQRLLLAIIAGLALGVLIFLVNLSQGFDLGAHNQTLENLRKLKQLDSQLNEETLKARLLINPDSTALADMQPVISKAVQGLNEGSNALDKLGSAPLSDAYKKYSTAMEEKLAEVDEFDVNNLALSESIDTIRRDANDVLAKLPGDSKFSPVRGQILQLTKEVLEFGLLPSPDNAQKLQDLSLDFTKIAPTVPLELQGQTMAFAGRTNSVLNQRQSNDQLLQSILSAPTTETLSAVQNAYDVFHGQRLKDAEVYRQILLIYSVALLIGLVTLGFRLRRSYIDLNKANVALARANETLESKVEERTRDLTKANAALKSSQAQVVQSEKMASLGQMVAGVAHEINTPLGFVRSNVELVGDMFKDLSRLVGQYAHTLGLIRSPAADEAQLSQAIGQLSMTEAEVDPNIVTEEGSTLLSECLRGLNQINDLVVNLKDFSRLDRSRMDKFDVNAGLDGTLTIMRNQLKDRIEIVRDYGTLPEIQGAPSQINQVFLNIFNNAQQAINGRGTIKVSTRALKDKVQVKIEDSGVGMKPEIMSKIFEPFFTTKEIGKGTGLGLSISYQIVQEHHGNIEVASTPGKGSTFTVTLPVLQKHAQEVTTALAAAAR